MEPLQPPEHIAGLFFDAGCGTCLTAFPVHANHRGNGRRLRVLGTQWNALRTQLRHNLIRVNRLWCVSLQDFDDRGLDDAAMAPWGRAPRRERSGGAAAELHARHFRTLTRR